MFDYFVRRSSALNGEAKGQIWFDCSYHPTASVEHGKSIKQCHVITHQDKQDYIHSGKSSMLDFLNEKYPEIDTDGLEKG